MDLRDDLAWVAIELTRQGELKVEDGTIASTVRNDLNVDSDHPVFVPAVSYQKGLRNVTLHLMEGYIFVRAGLPEASYFALERKSYVGQVMSVPGDSKRMRAISVIPNSHIRTLQVKLRELIASDIAVGATVRVVDGTYRALDGQVVELDEDHAVVRIELRSLKVLARVPRVFLEADATP